MRLVTRRRERKAHAERVRRWEEAMARWESRQSPEPAIVFDPGNRLTAEDVAEIRKRFLEYYRQRGARPFDER